MALVRFLTALAGVALSLANGYLLTLLAAAAAGRRRAAAAPGEQPRLRFLVLVPAHDEAAVIAATLDRLLALDYPPELREIVVIADNCTDATARIAAGAGVRVFEREEPARPGKGRALAYALERAAREVEYDAVAVVDADCAASPNLLSALGARLAEGHPAAQADYVVANPERSASAGLRFAAFSLMNTVRPLGKTRLGLSCGLLGTGMAFRREVLEAVPWDAFSIVEDAEYHAKLVASGRRVVFVPEARVSSEMPASLAASADQQMRWEGGRGVTIRTTSPRLLRGALRHRDPVRLHAALEWAVPPQSLLLAGAIGVAAATAALRMRLLTGLVVLNLLAQAVFVVGGLVLVRAPAGVYRALALAPVLVAQKLLIYARLAAGGTPRSFVRTRRG